jgi:hypothetical protein
LHYWIFAARIHSQLLLIRRGTRGSTAAAKGKNAAAESSARLETF